VSVRRVAVQLDLDDSRFKSKIAGSVASVKGFTRELERSASKRQALNEIGNAYGKIGTAAAIGVGAAVKAAVDWETAWAGVTKTTSGSAKQMAKLEDQLRGMARTMPATHQEIAAVAEAAGQLGVKRENIASFSNTMIKLGETTNLTADEAATSIARITNVMGTGAGEVDNLGATLVALGNNGASTERDIVQMAQGIAGAGKLVGASEGEVLAIANALSSVGEEAEAGGTAVSRVLMDMDKAIQSNGADLAVWAETSGMTVQEFARSFEQSPARALNTFVTGLARVKAEGGNVHDVLSDLGLEDIRVTRSILKLAGAGDLLSDSLNLQAGAWERNTALQKEYEKRQQTTAAQTQIAWNNIKDNLIDLGATALPMINTGLGAVTDIANAFGELPEPIKDITGATVAMTAVVGLSGFVFTRAVTGVTALRAALISLGVAEAAVSRGALFRRGGLIAAGAGLTAFSVAADDTSQTVDALAGTLGGAAIGAGIGSFFPGPGTLIGGAIGGLAGLGASFIDSGEGAKTAQKDVLDFASTLQGVDAQISEFTRRVAAMKLQKDGVLGDATAIGIPTQDLVSASLGEADALKRVTAAIDQALVSGNPVAVGVAGKILSSIQAVNAEYERQRQKVLQVNQATQTLQQALAGVPEQVVTRILAQGAPQTLAEVQALQQQYNLTPEQVATLVSVLGLEESEDGVVDLTGLLADFDGTEAQATADVDTAAAEAKVDSLASKLRSLMNAGTTTATGGRMGDNSTEGGGKAGGGRARGGPIFGPGTTTSDSVHIMASRDEHMWTAREVRAAGGHGAMRRLRNAALAGSLPRFARGGAIAPTASEIELERLEAKEDVRRLRKELKEAKNPPASSTGVPGEKKSKREIRIIALKLQQAKEKLARLNAGQEGPMHDYIETLTSGLGTFDLASRFSEPANPWSTPGSMNVAGWARTRLAKAQGFLGKLGELKKRGLGGMLLQEIAAMGIDTGTRAANALLSGPASDVMDLQNTYNQIESLRTATGEFLASASPSVQVANFRIDDWQQGIGQIELRITNGVASTVVGAIR